MAFRQWLRVTFTLSVIFCCSSAETATLASKAANGLEYVEPLSA